MKLTSVNLLDELNKPGAQQLRQHFITQSHNKGTMIYFPMEEKDSFFVVATGRVRIFLSFDDKEFTLCILKPGQVYVTHTSAYVQAMDDCSLLVTDTSSFHAGLADHPELTRAMLGVLGGMLKNSFSIINSLVFKDASRRLVELFLDEAADADPHNDSVTIDLGLTIEQLAQIVGSTRQTVSMLLNELVRSGDLEKVGRGTYVIPSLSRLRARFD